MLNPTKLVKDDIARAEAFFHFDQPKSQAGSNLLKFDSTFIWCLIDSVYISRKTNSCCLFICFTFRSISSSKQFKELINGLELTMVQMFLVNIF